MVSYVKTAYTFILLLFPLVTAADELRIAVAANFYSTLSLIKAEFEKQSQDKISIIKGSTGKLYAQIIHGAPFDIYMAADEKRPEVLEKKNFIIEGSRFTYAEGTIVLWANKRWAEKNKQDVLSILKNQQFKKLAIANPKIAPYGVAAIEVLEKLKLNNQFKHKMVYGENIAQAFQFVQTGSAQLGFIALSYIKPLKEPYWSVPYNLYTPLKQQAVILKKTKKLLLAQEFVDFMKSEKIKQLIKKQGYI